MQPASATPGPRRGVYTAAVVANDLLCTEHYRLALDVGTDFPPTRPGQFVQVQCAAVEVPDEPLAHDWPEGEPVHLAQPEVVHDAALLRRPFSLAGRAQRDGRAVLELIHRVVGVGTAWLTGLQPGDAVSVLGPLGNAFTWTDTTRAVLVGGGVGIPPMLYLAEALAAAGRPTAAFVGATRADLLPLTVTDEPDRQGRPRRCVAEFADRSAPATVCTDDGSLGFAGRVTEALWPWIDALAEADRAGLTIYTCGPEPMMRAVAAGCQRRNLACQVALERQMACGMGTCQSCVCKTRAANEDGFLYRLVCTDGPVFDAATLVWDSPGGPHGQREEHGKDQTPQPQGDRHG